jgi:hypothetical protein
MPFTKHADIPRGESEILTEIEHDKIEDELARLGKVGARHLTDQEREETFRKSDTD